MTDFIARDVVTGEWSTCYFDNVRFPSDISYGSTTIERADIGIDDRCAAFDVAPGVKTQFQLEALVGFFRARKGRATCFWYKDWVSGRGAVLVRFAQDRIGASLDAYGSRCTSKVELHEVALFELVKPQLVTPEF